jgi:hypothetical protein
VTSLFAPYIGGPGTNVFGSMLCPDQYAWATCDALGGLASSFNETIRLPLTSGVCGISA